MTMIRMTTTSLGMIDRRLLRNLQLCNQILRVGINLDAPVRLGPVAVASVVK